jgi:hypothetical protein
VLGCNFTETKLPQAVADEDGYVSLIKTSSTKSDFGTTACSWLCHRNAIFDVSFTGTCLLTRPAVKIRRLIICGGIFFFAFQQLATQNEAVFV